MEVEISERMTKAGTASNPIEHFNELGRAIEADWLAENYSEERFPDIAHARLSEFRLPDKLSAWDVVEWTLGETQLPEQRDLRARFGDPPITIFNAPRFHVDLYFWLEGTTAIHQHSFCGAFQVLLGSSIHSWYEFECEDIVNSFVELGKMSLRSVELLNKGDVQRILAGRQYIHGLFHLEQPSATIVVRTLKSPLFLPQFSYHKPSLAIDPFFDDPNAVKKIQCVSAMIRSKYPETDRLVARLLSESDFQTSFSILSSIRSQLEHDKMHETFNLLSGEDRFSKLLEVVKNRHGSRADTLEAVFEHMERVQQTVQRRGFISDSELRFFLALLMNVDGRERIVSLVSERFPDEDPVDKILDWTMQLAHTKVLGHKIPNALGIEDFNDLDLLVLEGLIGGKDEAGVRESFATEFPGEDQSSFAESLPGRIERIRGSLILNPLIS